MGYKFHYILVGAVLTLFVLGGAFSVGFSPTKAIDVPDGDTQVILEPQHAPALLEEELVKVTSLSQELAETIEVDEEFEPGPTTDATLIISTVKEFAARQEAALLGKPGWIFIKRTELASDEQREGVYSSFTGVSVPVTELVPAETPIFEGWSHVDERGLYHEALGVVTSANGAIHQHNILFEGQWYNLTLRDRGFPPEHYMTAHTLTGVQLPISGVLQWLEEIQNLDSVNLTAHLNDGNYVVVKESMYKEPLILGSPEQPTLPSPAIGDSMTYTFDIQTGQLLYEEVYLFLEDGSTFLVGMSEYQTEFMQELPPERATLYYDGIDMVKGEQ